MALINIILDAVSKCKAMTLNSLSKDDYNELIERIEKEKNINLNDLYPENQFIPLNDNHEYFIDGNYNKALKVVTIYCLSTKKVGYGVAYNEKLFKEFKFLPHDWLLTSVANRCKMYTCQQCGAKGIIRGAFVEKNDKYRKYKIVSTLERSYLTCQETKIRNILL